VADRGRTGRAAGPSPLPAGRAAGRRRRVPLPPVEPTVMPGRSSWCRDRCLPSSFGITARPRPARAARRRRRRTVKLHLPGPPAVVTQGTVERGSPTTFPVRRMVAGSNPIDGHLRALRLPQTGFRARTAPPAHACTLRERYAPPRRRQSPGAGEVLLEEVHEPSLALEDGEEVQGRPRVGVTQLGMVGGQRAPSP
jgi:hypothetical protein